jgi:telomere length regulation protein
MPSDFDPDDIGSLVHALQSPAHGISSILAVLTAASHATGLLPAAYNSYNVRPLSTEVSISKHVPLIQRTLLEHVAPSWELPLRQSNNYLLLEQFFCPVNVPSHAPATEVALLAYSTILSSHFTEFSVRLLQRLSVEFPMDMLYEAIFNGGSVVEKELIWENYVRNLLGVPSRVANAFGAGLKGEIPRVLEQAFYINSLCIQCERLIADMSSRPINGVLSPI